VFILMVPLFFIVAPFLPDNFRRITPTTMIRRTISQKGSDRKQNPVAIFLEGS
jgi:hypothetical protein